MAAILGGIAAVMAFFFFEPQFFATPPTATPVTVLKVESASPADEGHPGRFSYLVRLPDGTSASFSSESSHAQGTRLLAMVSRGRLTGRAVVAPPYSVLPGE